MLFLYREKCKLQPVNCQTIKMQELIARQISGVAERQFRDNFLAIDT